MTRPQIVRADTIDLQDPEAPSAKDHTRQPTTPSALGEGPPAPHQANALKNAGLDGLELRSRSPRASQDLSGKEIQLLQNHEDGDESHETNLEDIGGAGSQDGDIDGESDASLEDDMMDKISSSPSIDDGQSSPYPLLSTYAQHYCTQVGRVASTGSWRLPSANTGLFPSGRFPKDFQGSGKTTTTGHEGLPPSNESSRVTSPESMVIDDDDSSEISEIEYGQVLKITQASDMIQQQQNIYKRPELQDLWCTDSLSWTSDLSPIVGLPRSAECQNISSIRNGSSSFASDTFSMTVLPRSSECQNISSLRNDEQEFPPEKPLLKPTTVEDDPNMQTSLAEVKPIFNTDASHSSVAKEALYLDPVQVHDELDTWKLWEKKESHENYSFKLKRSPSLTRIDDQSLSTPGPLKDGYDSDDASLHHDPSHVAATHPDESLLLTEDIDFEFVYALHTFVATVEGQANATKGDTMVLLDDSNSYWWLVRIVKDSSIGYLPAEHIETPTERLARLNKHRNIDLSQTMLGDNTEKARSNPLRKARKRRNAKTVQFTDPTYYEASDREYSTDENDSADELDFITTADAAHVDVEESQQTKDMIGTAEPVQAQETPKENRSPERPAAGVVESAAIGAGAAAAAAVATAEAVKPNDSTSRESVDSIDDGSGASKKTRIRNTDSFYKDDSIETKKINLTPSLLREDDGSDPKARSNSKTQVQPPINRTRSSSESTIKSANSDKAPEKKKEKKSVLGRLFKAKNSKKAQAEEEAEEWIANREAAEKNDSRFSADNTVLDHGGYSTTITTKGQQPARTGSKLTKTPPPQKSNSFNKGNARGPVAAPTIEPVSAAPQLDAAPVISPITNPFSESAGNSPVEAQKPADNPSTTNGSIPEHKGRNLFAPIREALHKPEQTEEPRLEKAKKAPTREPIEISDDSDIDVVQPRNVVGANHTIKDRLSESPIHVSPLNNAHPQQDHSSDISRSMIKSATADSTPSSTPELIERPSQEMGASNASTGASSATGSRKDNFDWQRLNRFVSSGEFAAWHTVLMDVSEEMEDFDWKKHWAYNICKPVVEKHEETIEELDWTLVDYYDIEERQQKGLPQLHPPYRQLGWEMQWMRWEHDCKLSGKSPGVLPWDDPELAYLYPHRPSPPGAATGPPAGSIKRPTRDLRIIGPPALSMSLHQPDLNSWGPYPEPPKLAASDTRAQNEFQQVSKA